MSQEIEIEFKNLLTEKEYYLLMEYLPFPTNSVEQTNYYFDTQDFALRDKGAALRIRKKKTNYVLTLKEPHPDGLLETHDVLSEAEFKTAVDKQIPEKTNVKRQLDQLGIPYDQLAFFGALTTHRRETNYRDVLLVLDHSLYNNREDFELELEAASKEKGRTVFKEILEEYAIEEKETQNKIARFYNTL